MHTKEYQNCYNIWPESTDTFLCFTIIYDYNRYLRDGDTMSKGSSGRGRCAWRSKMCFSWRIKKKRAVVGFPQECEQTKYDSRWYVNVL